MKIYLAACFECKQEVKYLAEMLTKEGHEIVSRWHDGNDESDEAIGMNRRVECAQTNMGDILNCDALVLHILLGNGLSAGLQVEFGYALANCKKLFVYGKALNIFNHLAKVCHTWDDLKKALQAEDTPPWIESTSQE